MQEIKRPSFLLNGEAQCYCSISFYRRASRQNIPDISASATGEI